MVIGYDHSDIIGWSISTIDNIIGLHDIIMVFSNS